MNNTPIQVVIGPTASGKSARAIDMATAHNGVIINCDAMQCYDALHVLTAQTTQEEQAATQHRLYGHLHPNTHYTAADWRDDAIREIETAWANNQTPIICGGTGFYLKALMDGLSPIPEIPNDVRDQIIALYNDIGVDALFQKLKDQDPDTAAQIDPQNQMRIMRAWEVWTHTGKGLAEWQSKPLEGAPKGWKFHVTALFPNRDILIEKINKRLGQMIDQGAMDEVKALDNLIKNGDVADDALITKAHGFRAFRRYLNSEQALEDAIENTQIETRQYAKRQMTWLRNQISIDDVIEIT